MTVHFGAVTIDWFGLTSLRLAGQTGAVIYIDPGLTDYGILEGHAPKDGDLILVSHGHHYDSAAIQRVAHENAIVVVHESIDAEVIDRPVDQPEQLPYEIERVGDDESFVLGPLDLFTTPAYNDPAGPHTDSEGRPHHPEGMGCGFGVTLDGVTAFCPGDTDALAFHENLDVDLFMPPIGGTYTMDRHDAANLAGTMAPGLVLPVHYDTFDDIAADADAFVVDVARRGVPVVLES